MSELDGLCFQVEDAEFAVAAAVKARKGVELELQDVQKQLEDMTKTKQEVKTHLAFDVALLGIVFLLTL